jgi:Family of unknown function (DUF6178)
MTRSEGADIVNLSRYRAQLLRMKRNRRGDELLDSDDPEAAIRALPGDEFYYIVAERGFPDAIEILRHGSAEQIQTAFDFALWDRDQISPRAAQTWLAAIVDAPSERIYEWLTGIDIELMAFLIRQRAVIYNPITELPPEEPENVFWNTPDGSFQLDLRGDEEEQRITQRLIMSLYEADVEQARTLMVGIPDELDSGLEEMSYRWRNGRMQDLGFADYYEALEIYRVIDPNSVKIGEGRDKRHTTTVADEAEKVDVLRGPLALVDAITDDSLFTRAAALITDPAMLAELHGEIVFLSNRVLAAERIRPTDEDSIRDALTRMRATLDLGLEHICAGSNDEKACTALETIGLLRIFRVGATLITKVGEVVATLKREQPFAVLSRASLRADGTRVLPMGFFESDDAEVLAFLNRRRPVYPTRLDPPSKGASTDESRPFASLADIARASAAIERAATSMALLAVLGIKPEDIANLGEETKVLAADLETELETGIDVGVVARTVLALRVMDKPCPPLRGLSRGELTQLGTEAELKDRVVDHVRSKLQGRPLSPAAANVVSRWAQAIEAREGLLFQAVKLRKSPLD